MVIEVDTVKDEVVTWSANESATTTFSGENIPSSGSFDITSKNLGVYDVESEVVITTPVGEYAGWIESANEQPDFAMSASVATFLNGLSVTREAPPILNQPLSGIIQTYLALVYPTIPNIIDESSNTNDYSFIGWEGNVWQRINELCAVTGVELVYTGDDIIIRDRGGVLDTDIDDITPIAVDWGLGNSGRQVEVNYTDQIVKESTTRDVYNLVYNPSVETSTKGWLLYDTDKPFGTGWSGTSGERSNDWAKSGTYSFKKAHNKATTSGTIIIPIDPKVTITFGDPDDPSNPALPYLYKSTPEPVVGRFTVTVHATTVRTVATSYTMKVYSRAILMGGATRLRGEVTTALGKTATLDIEATGSPADVGPVWVVIEVPYTFTGTYNQTKNITVYADALMYTKNAAINYFDGSFPEAWWEGTPHDSVSGLAKDFDYEGIYNALADNNNVMNVNANETVEYLLENRGVYATALNPIIPVDSVGPVLAGEYTITASDNLPVLAAQWTEYGGRINLSTSGKGDIIITAVGPSEIPGVPGPYSFARSDGSTMWANLVVSGIGIRTQQKTLTQYTGANPDQIQTEIAGTVDTPFVVTELDAVNEATKYANNANSVRPTLNFQIATSDIISRGVALGKVFDWRNQKWRITALGYGETSTSVTATPYSIVTDFDAVWAGETVNDFDTFWSGKLVRDFNKQPLARS